MLEEGEGWKRANVQNINITKVAIRICEVRIGGQMRNMFFGGGGGGGGGGGWQGGQYLHVYQDVCIIRYTRDPESL